MTRFRSRSPTCASRSGSPPRPATPAAPARRSGGTGCCAPTARGPSASPAGTAPSSGSSPSAPGVAHYDEWYAGRPILVTANDYDQLLNNGDMGVTVRRADGRLRVVVQVGAGCASSPPPGWPASRPCTR